MGYIIKLYPRVYKELRDCQPARFVILRAIFELLRRNFRLDIDCACQCWSRQFFKRDFLHGGLR